MYVQLISLIVNSIDNKRGNHRALDGKKSCNFYIILEIQSQFKYKNSYNK